MTSWAQNLASTSEVMQRLAPLVPPAHDAMPVDASPAVDSRSLGQRFARGELAAAEQVVSVYYPRVTRCVHRLQGWSRSGETDDLVQEVFVRALSKRTTFRGDADLGTWLVRIAINVCRARQRQLHLRQMLLGIFARTLAPLEAVYPQDDDHQPLRDAVAALPAKYREVVVLHYLEEMPVAEVAQVMGLTVAAVHKRLGRARDRLHDRLGPTFRDQP